MEFVFEISEYNKDLTAQVAKGIRLCAEERSREVLPGTWELTDKINAANKGKKKPGVRHIIYGVLLLGMGIFLLVPGLFADPKHWDWIAAGAFGILIGLLSLTGALAGNSMNARCVKDAQTLLKHLKAAKGVTVRLTTQGMEAPGISAPYENFRWVMETRDTFLFVQNDQMTVLQKKDMKRGSPEELRGFLEKKKLPGTGLIKINA